MSENTFSIIMPTCQRKNLMQRSILSVFNQWYQNWELIAVDDGSTDGTWEKLQEYAAKEPRMKIIKHEVRKQRCAAINTGMRAATNDWICILESDDEYLRNYLNSLNWAINEHPQYRVFHFGALVVRLKYCSVRETPNYKEQGDGMESIKSGKLGMGSFIFKRELLNEIPDLYLFETGSPYKFADYYKDKFPEFLEMYGPKYMDGGKELGNPWGNDAVMMYLLTRKNKSKALPFFTYVNYIRRSGFMNQDDDKPEVIRFLAR